MRRRTYLGLLAVGLAGCSGTGSDETATTAEPTTETASPTATDATTTATTATTTETTTAAPPEFAVTAVDSPDEVEIGADYRFTITVENAGGRDGTFESAVSRKAGEDAPWEEVGTLGLDVPADGTATWESGATQFGHVQEVAFRLDDAPSRPEWTVRVVPARLRFGETAISPERAAATVTDVTFQDGYEYERYSGGTVTVDAPEGRQFAFVTVRVENQADEPRAVPRAAGFSLLVGDQQYDDAHIRKEEGAYYGGEVRPGAAREGWIAYEIPAEVARGDVTIAWIERYYEGEFAVYWSETPNG